MLANISTQLKTPNWLFAVVVVLPVLSAAVYYGAVASDVYVSESRFVVKSPEKAAASNLGVILKSAGFATGGDEVYAVQSFLTSRDALAALNRGQAFRKAYSRQDISIVDRFNPTGMFDSFENLYKYYLNKVELKSDSATSISTLTVRAYDPKSAARFNEQMLDLSESMVNKLNDRGRSDMIRFAEAEFQRAQAESSRTSAALAAYRNRSGVIDPEKQAQIQMQMVSKLQDELIAARTLLAQVRQAAPQNPQIPSIRSQISTIETEMAREQGKVVGTNRSLAGNAVRYQQLELENNFAEKQLAASLASLEDARNDARRKQAYVERIVDPSVPDSPTEPRRLRGFLATLLLSLVAYGILRMLFAGVREHAQ